MFPVAAEGVLFSGGNAIHSYQQFLPEAGDDLDGVQAWEPLMAPFNLKQANSGEAAPNDN